MFKKIMTLVLFAATASAWAEGTTSLTTGYDYSSGDYGGTSTTTIEYVPVIAKYQTEDYYLKLTVPYISVTSAGGVVRTLGNFKTKSTTQVTTQSGLGDVIASAGYTIFANDDLLLDLVGNVKFATADADKNLGTGENDYSAQLDGFYTISKTTLFATAGYKIIGAPADVNVNNIAYGTLGFSQKTSDKISAGAMVDAAQGSSEFSSGTRELSIFVASKLNKTSKIQASVLKGFTDSSPDYGFSVMITGSI